MLTIPGPKALAFLRLTSEPDSEDAFHALTAAYLPKVPPPGWYRITEAITGTTPYRCTDCGDIFPDDADSTDTDDGPVCEPCRDNYYTCEVCASTVRGDSTEYHNDAVYCDSCAESLPRCEGCSDVLDPDDYYSAADSGPYCEPCFDDRFTYCEICEEYFPCGDNHSHDCECESPHPVFHFPNNGAGTVPPDTRFTVTLPAGIISDEGIAQIYEAIDHEVNAPYHAARSAYYSTYSDEDHATWRNTPSLDTYDAMLGIGNEWQTKRGNYTRRISSAFYREHAVKLSPALISKIGNIARQHSATSPQFHLEVTRNLNLPAEDFYHEDSCWWQSYSASRCSLKQSGGIALRSFTDYGAVSGRVWIQPLTADLTPTHHIPKATAYVVYNGYGDLDGYTPARILAHLTGMTYRKVSFRHDPQYVNGNSAYLIAPQDVCDANSTLVISTPYEHHKHDA